MKVFWRSGGSYLWDATLLLYSTFYASVIFEWESVRESRDWEVFLFINVAVPCLYLHLRTSYSPHQNEMVRSTFLQETGGGQIAQMGFPPACEPGPPLTCDISGSSSSNE